MKEKTGEVKPGVTPDTEEKVKEKTAGADPSVLHDQTERLDDDVTKRLADAASK
jgi:hypothetical protein